MKPSAGTHWPPEVAAAIRRRDGFCVGPRAGFPELWEADFVGWAGSFEIDHVRASGGMGMKSRSTEDNGVLLCGWCHRWKTEHGREARPLLLAYLAQFYGVTA
jgi:hypothetical protein